RSLSGLAHDPLRINAGMRGFETYCVACHGIDGKGNQALGAPNLTDDVWLYGSSEATIVETMLNGRDNQMPAQKQNLTPEQIRLLAAWVWGLSNRQPQPAGPRKGTAGASIHRACHTDQKTFTDRGHHAEGNPPTGRIAAAARRSGLATRAQDTQGVR